ncbi:ribosome biogenesis GTPase Der [Candidatus Peregrinibacteria bacterium]|nr:ribosome biogenesis GTPase Der [Candidatus Peregrinibacteria bacterium]
MKIPSVAIIGRPNVGKSSLFNAISGTRTALTAHEAGTTRDRIIRKISTSLIDFFLIDTGGIVFGKKEETIEADVFNQAAVAIEEADIILFVTEDKSVFFEDDKEIAQFFRKKVKKKPVILVINKCDTPIREGEFANYFQLGLGEAIPVSALHKKGLKELEKKIAEACLELHFLSKKDFDYSLLQTEEEAMPQIAVVGRPNVGKSSLINAWLNKNRLIVSAVPGTTRDAIDTTLQVQKSRYVLIDTAGIRKAGRVGKGVESWSTMRTLLAIERCDIALLVIDSSQTVSHQDQQIAGLILKAGKGLVILANKWDIKVDPKMSEEERRTTFFLYLKRKFVFLPWVPVIFTSALTRKEMTKIFEIFDEIECERKKRIETHQLNQFVEEITAQHLPSGTKTTFPKIYYMTQVETNPPSFVIFVNKKKNFHFSYWRYLENRLREKFGFMGTSIKLEFREKQERN